jgi:hypothetical protein
MVKDKKTIPEDTKIKVISLSNNRCCVCQTPFVVLHHIDTNPSNNALDNLAPLCPNCHSQAHSQSQLTTNLTPSRIKILRDKWYSYCENRKDGSNISGNALLKLKNLVRSLGPADHSWKKTFSTVNPDYGDLGREEIINRVFSTSNRDDLVAALETVKHMYGSKLNNTSALVKFEQVCNAFGIGYDELF